MESGAEAEVREMTGLYGPVFLNEKQVQRIWAARAFAGSGLVTRSGRRLEILDPGRWNFQEGPDFREAILEIDGRRRHGDVEIHLHEKDWNLHRHGEDPRFDGVILHVVLFPDRSAGPAAAEECGFETLEWLPRLDRDLETYLDDWSVDQLMEEELPRPLRDLAEWPAETRERALHDAARARWERKGEAARRRLAREGWEAACHQAFLETLGLRRNRALMGRIACEEPVESWVAAPEETAARAWERHREAWSLAGCRPANHPRRRLESYARWIGRRGNPWRNGVPWPDAGPGGGVESARAPRVASGRKSLRLPEREKRLRAFFAPAVGGTRFHTWIGDGLLPLLTANDGADRFRWWFLWPAGDLPDRIREALKRLEILGPGRPHCNGWAQGLLRMLEPDYEPSG